MNGLFSSYKKDLSAGLIVFLVALPLCLGIALASGAPLISGVIAGIVGGIVVGSLSGSNLGVSGPAAGLAVIVLNAITEMGSFEIFLAAVVLAGLLQLILGFIGAGVIAYYFPSAVIKGMLAAIGVIIFLKQIPHAVGYDKDYEGEMSFVQVDGENTFSELINMLGFIHPSAVIIVVLSLLIYWVWSLPALKEKKFFKLVQAPLVVVVVGVVLSNVFKGIPGFELAQEHLVNVPIFDSWDSVNAQLFFPDFSNVLNKDFILLVVTIAVIASIETLLCLEASDKMDPEKRVSPVNRELRAQGIGNMVSGLIGGLPVTQVVVRSTANIQSGGKTKLSAIFHGFLLLGFTIAIPMVLNMIPLSSLAAILLVVGYKLANPAAIKQEFSKGWVQFIPYLVTILAIVFTDLLVGIGIGLAVSICFLLIKNYFAAYAVNYKEHDGTYTVELAQDVNFINKASFLKFFVELKDNSTVIIDMRRNLFIDNDVKEVIDEFMINAKTRGIEVKILKNENIHSPEGFMQKEKKLLV